MKTVFRVLLFLVVLAAGGGAWWYFVKQQGTIDGLATPLATLLGKPAGPAGPGQGPGGGASGGGMPTAVEAQPVKVGAVARRVSAVGSLMSSESVLIRSEVPGRIVEIVFNEGARVRKGQTLVKLDDAIARATLVQAEASLNLSRAEYQRAIQLTRQGAAAERTRDEAIAKLHADEAEVALTKAQLEKLVLVAPFDGDVGLRRVSVGSVIQMGQDLVNLEAIDPLKVDFRVPELYLSSVAVGQAVAISVDAFPGRSFEGQVYAIDPLIDVNGRSINIRARVPNPDRTLRPGLFARVTLTLKTRTDAIIVPEQALVAFGTNQFVYKVVEGKVVQTKVTLGERRNGEVEVVEGLAPDDTVVTAGQMKIRDGAPVAVVNAAKTAGG